ncbi:MAG: hypothetical protein U1F58_14900 [Burkholderiales bacterium]
MKAADTTAKLWSRKPAGRTRPDRRAGGFYRTSDGTTGTIGSIPLNQVDDAVVAAVRMAYRVAEAQIDRGSRLAQRLRDAGDRAVGGDSRRKSLDATERLVFRTMMGGLSWLEAAASAEEGSPLLRLAAAEYRLLGTILGLAPGAGVRKGRAGSGAPEAAPPGAAEAPVAAPARGVGSAQDALDILHKVERPRAVRVLRCDIARAVADARLVPLVFYRVDRDDVAATMKADLVVAGDRTPRLVLSTPIKGGAGIWRAAVCNLDGLQVGCIEIET